MTYCTIVLQSKSHALFNRMCLLLGYTGISLPLVVESSRISLFLTLITMSSEGFSDGNINSQAIESRALISNAFLSNRHT